MRGVLCQARPHMAVPEAPLVQRSAAGVFDRWATRRLLVVSGKGGVGRTTVAALMGLAIADRGRRVLVATTGHDDRLAWMLGAGKLGDTPERVAPGLWVQRLTAQTCIREYGGLVLRSQRMSTAVFDNRIVRRFMRAIPGLDDFAVVGKAWHEATRGQDFDTVVFDGPATGHLLYTLGVPLAILGAVPKGPLTREAELMQGAFEDRERVEAVLVGLPERWPLTELVELGVALRERVHMHVSTIVVNGLLPTQLPEVGPPPAAVDPEGVVAPVFAAISRLRSLGREQLTEIERWSRTEAAQACGAEALLLFPWRLAGVLDLAATRSMLAAIESSGLHSEFAAQESP